MLGIIGVCHYTWPEDGLILNVDFLAISACFFSFIIDNLYFLLKRNWLFFGLLAYLLFGSLSKNKLYMNTSPVSDTLNGY